MRIKPTLASLALTWVAAALPGASAIAGPALAIKAMPAELETRYALSALPAKLRDEAGVYLLDPDKGYTLTRSGTNGLECLVARESWDWAEFRDDIYFPLCFDAAGRSTYQRVSLDVAGLRARGMSATAVKAEIEKRYRDKTYQAPARAGLSYMVAPVMRALGPPRHEGPHDVDATSHVLRTGAHEPGHRGAAGSRRSMEFDVPVRSNRRRA